MHEASPPPRLTIELVPSTCWYSNVRSNVRAETWDRIQAQCFQSARHRCEICGGVGPAHPVECHEIWHYDDVRHIQRLDGLVSLCPACHQVKHIGRAIKTGAGVAVIQHFARVNGVALGQATVWVREAMMQCQRRSQNAWTLDVRLLAVRFGVKLDAQGREVGLRY